MGIFSEKRRHPRILAKYPIRIRLENPPYSLETETVDLSESGLRFTFPEAIDIPKYLTLEFNQTHLPYKVEIDSEVKWQNRASCGVEFNTFRIKEIDNIKKLLWLCEEYIERNIESLLKKIEAVRLWAKDLVKTFFIRDVKNYLEDISRIYKNIEGKVTTEEIGCQEINKLTNDILREGAGLLSKINNKILSNEIKKTFRAMTGNWIYESIYMKCGFEKPRGYPGDYMLMETIYNNRPGSEGIGVFIDRYFLNNSYADSVRHRKDKVVDILNNFFKSYTMQEMKILNIGAGPCRELRELFNNSSTCDGGIIITNVDYDEEALEFSRHALQFVPNNVECRFLKEDILKFPREREYYCNLLGKQDLIYSLGLADYIPDRLLTDSIGFWYSLLVKDGQLVITHKDIDANPEAPYAPDWFCDWKFVTRNRQDFINLVKNSVTEPYLLQEESEPTGKIVFLTIKKLFD